jgi:hypothetical protein
MFLILVKVNEDLHKKKRNKHTHKNANYLSIQAFCAKYGQVRQ